MIIPAELDYMFRVRQFIEKIGVRYAFTARVINAAKLSVEEACTNIIRHGYKGLVNGKITIQLLVRYSSLTIVLVDQGHTFDPRTVKNPDLAKYVEMGKIGGLGIMMIRRLMDKIDYSPTRKGNVLKMIIYRDKPKKSYYKRLKLFFRYI